jgi:diacylglycerol kinase family enzyme
VYHYVYDSFLSDPKYAKTLTAIENRLTDLGIYGSVHRLALFKSMKGAIGDAVRRGAATVVVVGDDLSVAKAVDANAELKNAVFGIIPIGAKNFIADLLGIPKEEAACDTLSARLILELDLGKVNNHYFLTSLSVPGAVKAECDGRYTVSPVVAGEICVNNFSTGGFVSNPRDGLLETIVKTAKRNFFGSLFARAPATAGVSVFPVEKAVIRSGNGQEMTAMADGQAISDAEFRVEVMPHHLKVIVGKDRKI